MGREGMGRGLDRGSNGNPGGWVAPSIMTLGIAGTLVCTLACPLRLARCIMKHTRYDAS